MDRFGLLGRSLAHSLSPQIHAFFGDYPYDIIEKEPEELQSFFENCPYRAINVTIPYKKDVMPFCDEIDESARRIGSVNTICFDNDAVRGYNTDYAGFSYLYNTTALPSTVKKPWYSAVVARRLRCVACCAIWARKKWWWFLAQVKITTKKWPAMPMPV